MKINVLIIIVFFALKSYSQTTSDYIIFSFVSETYYKGDKQPANTFNWITAVDSINISNQTIPLYPTYLNLEYSNDCLIRCCDNKKIDFITSSTATNYNYSDQHIKQQEFLQNLVFENMLFVQKIQLNWTEYRYKKIIKVYATPIKGVFCDCGIYGASLRFTDGRNKVFIPNSDFSLMTDFWETEIGQFVKFFDYSHLRAENYH